MIPLRFFLGAMTMWILSAFCCNWLNGLAMTTGIPESLSGSANITTTYSVDASGAPAQYQSLSTSSLQEFTQFAFFDYPALFNDENGEPDELRSALRYSIFLIIGICFLVALAFTMKQIFGM